MRYRDDELVIDQRYTYPCFLRRELRQSRAGKLGREKEFMLDEQQVKRLENRATSGLNGYAADVTITCYVYGADVISLLNERRVLLGEIDRLQALVPRDPSAAPASAKSGNASGSTAR